MITTKTQSTFPAFPANIYKMTIKKVEQGTSKTNGGDFLRWFIRIEDELPAEVMKNHKEPIFTILTSTELTEKNNFGRFLNVIGFNVSVGESLDTDALIGYTFIAKVTAIKKNGKENNNIDNVPITEYEAYRKNHKLDA